MEHTSDVFLLWSCLVWIRRLLDIHDKFGFRLVFVDWSRGVVYFIAVNIVGGRARPVA